METGWILIITFGTLFVVMVFYYLYLITRKPGYYKPKGFITRLSFNKIAKNDYQKTRGYQHLCLLRKTYENIAYQIQALDQSIQNYQNQIHEIKGQLKSNLYSQYCDKMMNNFENEVHGIGQIRAQSIRSICYNGSLESLRNAQHNVRGIGNQIQYNINHWVRQKILQYDSFIDKILESKNEISQPYWDSVQEFNKGINKYIEYKRHLIQLNETIYKEISDLSIISEKEFQCAQVKGQIIMPVKLINGAFAPWEPMPAWFKEAVEKYGG